MNEQPGAGREAAMVWLKLLGLLVLVAAFGLLVFWLRRVSIGR
jgi:LPXTG-motif cell wall-anchored protein